MMMRQQKEIEAKATGELIALSRGDQVVWRYGKSPTMTVLEQSGAAVICGWFTTTGEYWREDFKRPDLVLLGPKPALEEVDGAGGITISGNVAGLPALTIPRKSIFDRTCMADGCEAKATTIITEGCGMPGGMWCDKHDPMYPQREGATNFRHVQIGFRAGLGMVHEYSDGSHTRNCPCRKCAAKKVVDFPSKNGAK